MVQLKLVTGEGAVCVPVRENILLSEALRLHGQTPSMPCGGSGRCGKCRVIAAGRLSPLSAEERGCLSEEEIAQGVRLACQCTVLGDAEVRLIHCETIRQIRASGVEQEFVHAPMFSVLGAAVDVGTTTLAAQLYGQDGLLASAAAENPQRAYGADVISRIGCVINGNGQAMARCVRKAIGSLLAKMCIQAGRGTEEIDSLVITGNTAMLHLLAGEDPSPLAAAPFAAKELFGKTISANALDLPCAPDARVYLPRCMSAFVGGDISTALLSSGICRKPESAMLTDIGTNGEIALWHQGSLTCCSTAAGPAFEGASLSQGMQGAPGAIDRVWLQGNALAVHTIGDQPAVGICGSGVADVLACLLETGQLDETGYLTDGTDFVSLTSSVSFTQKDVRQVQLAKSAVRAGIETLLQRCGLVPEDLSCLMIAGGFGSYLSLDNAAAIGLIPQSLVQKSRVLGNAALSGAAMILRSCGLQDACTALAEQARTIELAADPDFMNFYMDHMMF